MEIERGMHNKSLYLPEFFSLLAVVRHLDAYAYNVIPNDVVPAITSAEIYKFYTKRCAVRALQYNV